MVWAAFCSKGILEMQFVSSKMKSVDYINVLQMSLVPFLRRYRQSKMIFQQDNARIHVSKETNVWFKDSKIDVLDWPACSPDLNPMENLWAILVRDIYAENKQYNTVQELKTAIVSAWSRIEKKCTDNLLSSINSRIFQVINRSGGLTDY